MHRFRPSAAHAAAGYSGKRDVYKRQLFASVRFLTTAIVSEMSYAAYGSLQRDALFSVGLVLFLFILLINAALRLLSERSAKA